VSHDRYLVQAVATHIWVIDGGQVQCIIGGWEAFSTWRNKRRNAGNGKTGSKNAEKTKQDRKAEYRRNRRLTNLMQRLKRRHEEIEAEIEIVEAEIAKLNDEISAASESGDTDRVGQLSKEYPARETKLESLWNEWEHIGEELGKQ
ncbi:MAG: hypothetical protein KAV00_13475, partial [Phycisphaerae bacterium]|nr:hypothetical protein [Phycisphaerae bacterium]